MVCIYCGGKTQVTNSRLQKRLNHTWRRRQCSECGAVFTTEETVELAGSLMVGPTRGPLRPFSRDKLFISIWRALGHRETALYDAAALTATTIGKLLHGGTRAAIPATDISRVTHETLERFDTAAAVQYRAYHQG